MQYQWKKIWLASPPKNALSPAGWGPLGLAGDGGHVSPLQRVPSRGEDDEATSGLESTTLAGHGLRFGLEAEVSRDV